MVGGLQLLQACCFTLDDGMRSRFHVKHVMRYLQDLEDMVLNKSESDWPLATKIAWRLRMAVDQDVGEANSPSFYFRERLAQIQHAVNMQGEDRLLWSRPTSNREEYLQRALRDLHRVIENDGSEEALTMIRGRLDT